MGHLPEPAYKLPVVPYIRECDFAFRKPWVVPERRLLDYLLVYIREGHCRFWVDGAEYHFNSGDFCLIQPGSLNRLEGLTETVTPFAHFDIFYNPNREMSFPTRAGQVDLSAYGHLLQPTLEEVFGIMLPVRLAPRSRAMYEDSIMQMVKCWQNPDPLMQLKAQHLATELVLLMLEDHRSAGSPPRDSQPTLDWVPSYFSIHLTEPLSIKNMASRAHLSPSRFSALFKERYGMPPHRYLLDMRVRHARELLETTGLSQEEIAAYCGFADVHHFSKVFKSKTGKPPGHFRAAPFKI